MSRITKIEAAKVNDKRKLRVATYARVSTDSEEQLLSLDTQKNHYETYIKVRLGIYIFFEKENIDTGKMESELLLSILSSLAESESHSIAENSKWSIQKRFQNGTFKISYPPYGYENVNGKVVVDEEKAETVRWIFAEILAGKAPVAVAKELNRKGIPSKRGGRWEGHVINAMIKNEKPGM